MSVISLFRPRSRPKKDASPDSIPILLLILSWIYPGPAPISLPFRSWFYPDSTPALVLILSRPYPYCGSVPIPMLSWFYPHSIQKENLVSFRVRDTFWLSLDNDFSTVLEKYLWHMSCDNMTFGRSLGGTYKLLFLTKNWSRSDPCRKLWFRDYFVYRYLNHFYISLEGKVSL